MVDRYRVWLGAGVLAGGVSAAMLAGAGVAVAEDGTSSGASASSGSDDADKTESPEAGPSADSADSDDSDGATTGAGKHRTKSRTGGQQSGPASEDEPARAPDSGSSQDGDDEDDADADADAEADAPAQDEVTEPVAEEAPADVEASDPSAEEAAVDVETPSSFVSSIETDLSSSDGAAVMHLAAASTAWPGATTPSIFDFLNDLCTNAYNWYTGAMQFIAGPARAPFGSRVRVESSDLTIGNGVVVPADWYFPPGSTPATGLIYLQHGMLATSRFYSATAAYLAEKTHSIVVVPTLTWNPFDTVNYPVMLPSTHRAIADLFTGDRAALNASAKAAGFRGTLPTRVVLAGHSAGGGLVVGTARYMVENGSATSLAGVVMLDGAGIGGIIDLDLAKIPDSIPIYNLGAAPSSWNNNGHAARRLAQARPDMFTGALVHGGHHSDSMQSSSGAVQFMAYLATGFSSPLNIAANQLLSAGWINDMFNGTHTPRFYGSSVSPVTVVTGSWRSSARSTKVLDVVSRTATAPTACPAAPTALSCADPSEADIAGRAPEGVAARSA